MQRRAFLQQGAAALAVGVSARDATCGAAQPEAKPGVLPAAPPPILITAVESRLSQVLAKGLAAKYEVRTAGEASTSPQKPLLAGDLGTIDAARAAVRGVRAIVHPGLALAGANESQRIDACTRSTFNLLSAAVAEGVPHAVFLSSLEMMTAYDQDFAVAEDWQPLPKSGGGMAEYLGEYTCREFARTGQLQIVVLRFGRAVDDRDVLQAVSLALGTMLAPTEKHLGPWSVFHIASDLPDARFSIAKARRELGYEPKFPVGTQTGKKQEAQP